MRDNYQYYPTPEALSKMAWAKFKNRNFIRVLEPSAGDGHLPNFDRLIVGSAFLSIALKLIYRNTPHCGNKVLKWSAWILCSSKVAVFIHISSFLARY